MELLEDWANVEHLLLSWRTVYRYGFTYSFRLYASFRRHLPRTKLTAFP